MGGADAAGPSSESSRSRRGISASATRAASSSRATALAIPTCLAMRSEDEEDHSRASARDDPTDPSRRVALPDLDVVFMSYELLRKQLGSSRAGSVLNKFGFWRIMLDEVRSHRYQFDCSLTVLVIFLPLYESNLSPLTDADILYITFNTVRWCSFPCSSSQAQLVANSSSVAAVVASQLWRRHAWVVTGTPVCSNLSEVKGLCQFLALEPYHENTMWNRMVNSVAS